MANVDRPNGFRIVSRKDGACYNGAFRKFYSPNDNLFVGDLVEQETGSSGGIYPGVDRIDDAADRIAGVVVGFEHDPDNLGRLYHAASTSLAVYVADVNDLILEAQSNDNTMTVGDIGLNISPTVTAGSVATGLSNMELSGVSADVTNTLTLRVVGAVDRADNDVADLVDNQRWLVTVNSSADANLTVGV